VLTGFPVHRSQGAQRTTVHRSQLNEEREANNNTCNPLQLIS